MIVLKGVAQMFQVSTMPDAPFKISLNRVLSSRCGQSAQSPIRSTTLRFSNLLFFVGGFSFFFKNNLFDYQQLTQYLKKYLKKYLLFQKVVCIFDP